MVGCDLIMIANVVLTSGVFTLSPGRFFAAFEMKLMLAYILLNYDVKFEAGKEGIRPENKWFGSTIIPDPTVNVMFRKRQI